MKLLKKNKKLSNISLYILAFVFLIIISEMIYQLSSGSELKYWSFIGFSRYHSVRLNLPSTLDYLKKAAILKIDNQKNNFSEIIPPAYTLEIDFPLDDNLNKEILDYLKKTDYKKLAQTDPKNLAKTYYYLGLISYHNNQPDLVVPFWQFSIYLAPWWSHFHVELANFYLKSGNFNESEDVLNKCISLDYTKKHCQMYLEENYHPNTPREIGFLEEFIEEEI